MHDPFLWGAATSAHQVEGTNTNNDWWQWEQTQGNVQSGKACDHYHRFREDFALAKQLGHTAHRLSLEWSRIEPKPGVFDPKALEHYREVLQELRRLNLRSFVTLHHFTNPVWFTKLGGWENPKAPHLFARYVDAVMRYIGEEIDVVTTINEPMVYASNSFWHGIWPPHRQSFWAMVRVAKQLAKAHTQAFHVIRKHNPQIPVGIAKHVIGFRPARPTNVGDRWLARIHDYYFNHWFLSRIAGTYDYIGLNYYFAFEKKLRLFPPRIMTPAWEGAHSDMQWPLRPDAFTDILLSFKQYKVPLYVTENGVADARDVYRADFIRDHVRAIEAAQKQGANVRGYFYWSLLDNFEWDKGFAPRFGLLAVDYTTFERKPRPSAWVYKAIIDQQRAA